MRQGRDLLFLPIGMTMSAEFRGTNRYVA